MYNHKQLYTVNKEIKTKYKSKLNLTKLIIRISSSLASYLIFKIHTDIKDPKAVTEVENTIT